MIISVHRAHFKMRAPKNRRKKKAKTRLCRLVIFTLVTRLEMKPTMSITFAMRYMNGLFASKILLHIRNHTAQTNGINIYLAF